MKYFEWLGDITGVNFPEAHFREKWWMVECEPVSGWDDALVGTYDPDAVGLPPKKPPTFHFGLALNGWPICSAPMREFLEANASGLAQFLPFVLQTSQPPGRLQGYSVVQFLRSIDCLDRVRTQVRKDWKPVNEFGDVGIRWPVTLVQAAMRDESLFRIKGYSVAW